MSAKPLQQKIIGFLILLLLVVLGAFWAAMVVSTNNHATQQIDANLAVGERVFLQLLTDREKQLINSARVLTADFGFKQAVATEDKATIVSVLSNHGDRINADLMMLLSLEGELAATSSNVSESITLSDATLTSLNNDDGSLEYLWVDNALYQVVLLPVKAPRPIAIAAVGFKIDQTLANKLKQLTLLNVTFDVNHKDQRLVISTLPEDGVGKTHFKENKNFVFRKIELANKPSLRITGYLSLSAKETFKEFDLLKVEVFAISVLAFLFSILAGTLGAKRLASPLKSLANTAKIIAKGNFRESINSQESVLEIKDLTQAFNIMQQGLAEREERIIFQSQHDALTGLLNRQTLISKIDNGLKKNHSGSLCGIALNVSRLQDINDSFGHNVGDQCLKEIAWRLTSLSPDECIVARLGGDEFFIGFTMQPGSKNPLKKLKGVLTQPYNFNALSINLDFSFGIASIPENGNDASDLIKNASIALDLARRDRAGVATYDSRVEEEHLKKLRLLADLRKELEQSSGQLFMCYQPKVSTSKEDFLKFEALIRWIHPDHGFVSPELFIPLAEQAGLIEKVTDWVLVTVIKQASEWRQQGMQSQIAINLSARDLSRPALLDFIKYQLDAESLPKNAVTFEITESEIMADPEQGIQLLERFRSNGFELALDDFGTGYSSLSQLKNMPVSILKIDKSFVLKLDQHKDDQIIVRSTIELAHKFNLKVVAEGVENLESLKLLQHWGCDWIQGYYISKPIPANEVLNWHKHQDDWQQKVALP